MKIDVTEVVSYTFKIFFKKSNFKVTISDMIFR